MFFSLLALQPWLKTFLRPLLEKFSQEHMSPYLGITSKTANTHVLKMDICVFISLRRQNDLAPG